MVVVICGVAGAGKTTVGRLLGQELGWNFYDGDDFHPAANIGKMRRGIPLTDQDRHPWLATLRRLIERCLRASESAVVACSALKKAYRDYLRVSDEVKLVFLRAEYSLVAEQLRQRRGHFFDATLLQSQFADLEEPQRDENALTIELGRSPYERVSEIKAKLQLQPKSFESKEEP
jgi:gluconokinase